jgi:hypothetical protein
LAGKSRPESRLRFNFIDGIKRMPVHVAPADALNWMETERANLYSAVSYATDTSRHVYTIALSSAMDEFLCAGDRGIRRWLCIETP